MTPTTTRPWSAALLGLLLAACKPETPPTQPMLEPRPSTSASASIAPPASASAQGAAVAIAAPDAPDVREPLAVSDVLFVPTGKQQWSVVLVHADRVRIVDPTTAKTTWLLPHAGAVDHVSVLASRGSQGSFVSLTAGEKHASLWTPGGALVTTFPWIRTHGVQAITVSKDAKRAAVLLGDRVVVGSTDAAAETKPLASFDTGGPCFSVAFHDDGRHLVVASAHQATVFDLQKNVIVGDSHSTDTGGTFPTSLSPDGRWVAASTAAGHKLTVWQSVPWRTVAHLGTAPDCGNHVSCAFSDDGGFLYGAAGSAWSKAFEAGSWRVVHAANPGRGSKHVYTLLSDNGYIGLRGEASNVEIVDAKTKVVLTAIQTDPTETVRLSPDGAYAVRFGGKGFSLLETRTSRVVLTVPAPPSAPTP